MNLTALLPERHCKRKPKKIDYNIYLFRMNHQENRVKYRIIYTN